MSLSAAVGWLRLGLPLAEAMAFLMQVVVLLLLGLVPVSRLAPPCWSPEQLAGRC